MNSTTELIVFAKLDSPEIQPDNVPEETLPQHVDLMNNMTTSLSFAFVNTITIESMDNVNSQLFVDPTHSGTVPDVNAILDTFP